MGRGSEMAKSFTGKRKEHLKRDIIGSFFEHADCGVSEEHW